MKKDKDVRIYTELAFGDKYQLYKYIDEHGRFLDFSGTEELVLACKSIIDRLDQFDLIELDSYITEKLHYMMIEDLESDSWCIFVDSVWALMTMYQTIIDVTD